MLDARSLPVIEDASQDGQALFCRFHMVALDDFFEEEFVDHWTCLQLTDSAVYICGYGGFRRMCFRHQFEHE